MLLAAYGLYLLFLKTHPDFFQSAGGTSAEHNDEGHQWHLSRAIGTLVGASVLAAWMSEMLVGAAEYWPRTRHVGCVHRPGGDRRRGGKRLRNRDGAEEQARSDRRHRDGEQYPDDRLVFYFLPEAASPYRGMTTSNSRGSAPALASR